MCSRFCYIYAMTKKEITLVLFFSILAFAIGYFLEPDYRFFTRSTIQHLADYDISFYPAKDFRIIEIDIALIMVLIPLCCLGISKNENLKFVVMLIITFLVIICMSYFGFCYLESIYIYRTGLHDQSFNGELNYHKNNVNYRLILLSSIIVSCFAVSVIRRKFK